MKSKVLEYKVTPTTSKVLKIESIKDTPRCRYKRKYIDRYNSKQG